MSESNKINRKMSNPLSWWILNILTTCFIATAIAAFSIRAARTSGGGGSGGVRVLRLGHGLSPDHPVHQAMLQMAERLRELSSGTMDLQIYPSGMIGSEDECFKQAQNAQIEFAKCSAAVLDGSVPEFQVVGAPFLFRDSDHFWAVMNGEIGKSLLRKIDGLMGICYFDAGARSLYTTKKPVHSPADMKGLKIRTQKSSIAMQSMEALGASPTPISWGELYTALSQGTVDAAENNIPSFVTGRHFEVCKYFIFTEHQRVPDVLVMSRKIWDDLSAEQKAWIEQAAAEANLFQRKAWRESEIVNERIAREAGVEFITVDRAPFMELSKPVYDAFPEKLQELAKRIQEVK
jgi:tripartite ATP-independent transporter DctP family solute receptor